MKYKDFLEKNKELLKGKQGDECLFSLLKENTKLFLYPGIYVLADQDEEVVYIGSAYARNLRSRLLQYQQKRGSGNSTLFKDLIDGGKTTKDNARNYILSLKIYSFKDESLEYILICNTDGVVNIAGNDNEKMAKEAFIAYKIKKMTHLRRTLKTF